MLSARRMKSESYYKTLLFVLAALSVAAATVLATAFLQTWREYETVKARKTQIAADLQKLQDQIGLREEYFERLLNDGDFFERVVRQRLGYSRNGEIIFKFEPDSAKLRAAPSAEGSAN